MVKKREEWRCERCQTPYSTEADAQKCEDEHLDLPDSNTVDTLYEHRSRVPTSFRMSWVVPAEEAGYEDEPPGTLVEIRCSYHQTRDTYREIILKKKED